MYRLPANLRRGLVLDYQLGSQVREQVPDLSDNKNHGVSTGGWTDQNTRLGVARFNGDEQYVNIPAGNSWMIPVSGDRITYEFFYYFSGDYTGWHDENIFWVYPDGNNRINLRARLQTPNAWAKLTIQAQSTYDDFGDASTDYLPDDTFHHVVTQHEWGDGTETKIFINLAEQTSCVWTINGNGIPTVLSSTDSSVFGYNGASSDPLSFYFLGARIWSRFLTSAERHQLYQINHARLSGVKVFPYPVLSTPPLRGWIGNRTPFNILTPASGATGEFDTWVDANTPWWEAHGTIEEEAAVGLPSRRAIARGILRGVGRGVM